MDRTAPDLEPVALVPTERQIIASDVMDLSGVTFVVSVKGGKLVLRPGQPNPLLVAYLAAVPTIEARPSLRPSRTYRRAVLITSTCPRGRVEEEVLTLRRWATLLETLRDDTWYHAKSYPGCGDRESEDQAFVLGMEIERADILAERWEQNCYLDIDIDQRPDGRPLLVRA